MQAIEGRVLTPAEYQQCAGTSEVVRTAHDELADFAASVRASFPATCWPWTRRMTRAEAKAAGRRIAELRRQAAR